MRFFNITEIAPAIEMISHDKQNELLELLQRQPVIKPEDVVPMVATHLLNHACMRKRFRCAIMILDFTNADPSALGSNNKSAIDHALESSPIDHEFIAAILSNYQKTKLSPSQAQKKKAAKLLQTAELTSAAVMILLELVNFVPIQTISSSAALITTQKSTDQTSRKRSTSNLDALTVATVSASAASDNTSKRVRTAETGHQSSTPATSSSSQPSISSAWDDTIAHLKELTKFEENLYNQLKEYSRLSSNMNRVSSSLLSMTGCSTLEEVAAKFPQCRIKDAKFLNANHYSINQLLKQVAALIEQPQATVPPPILVQLPLQPMPPMGLQQPSPFMGFSPNASSYVLPSTPFFPTPTEPANPQYFGAPPGPF